MVVGGGSWALLLRREGRQSGLMLTCRRNQLIRIATWERSRMSR
jgi:hypothetical protein